MTIANSSAILIPSLLAISQEIWRGVGVAIRGGTPRMLAVSLRKMARSRRRSSKRKKKKKKKRKRKRRKANS